MKFSMRLPVLALAVVLSIALIQSCKHDAVMAPTSVKKWGDIPIKSIFEVPAPAGRNEEGEVTLELFSDNSLAYTFHIHNLSPSDALVASHIHFGDPGTSGPIFINFAPSFVGAGATGKITGLRAGQVDTLLNKPCYFNAHSSQVGSGIVRGQLDKTIDFAMDVPLNGANEAPTPVTTTASGLAILRLTNKTLYSKVMVSNLESNDTFTVSHIHRGAVGVAGPIRINLVLDTANFNKLQTIELVDSLVTILKNDPIYVNVHSRRKGSGIMRGQIR